MGNELANLPNGLRLMVYDMADAKKTIKALRKTIPKDHWINKTIDEIDEKLPGDVDAIDLELPIGMTYAWITGGRLYRWLRWIDEAKGFDNWEDALEWIANYKKNAPISQVQFWGHGSPGKSWMMKTPKAITANDFEGKTYLQDHIAGIKKRLRQDSVLWFRNCSVFAGNRGREFGMRVAQAMQCRVAAHTYTIALWQSGLHVLSPGEKPDWDPMEGIKEGTAEHPRKFKWSERNAPNTVFMLTGGIPGDF